MSSNKAKEEHKDMEWNHQKDDELVREIDVFIAPELSEQLHLMQFPLHHGQVPLPDSARIKQRHGIIELEHSVPGNIGTEGGFFLTKRKQASQVIPITTHLALGKLSNDGASMHLVPTGHIVQIRPDFGHIDESDQQAAVDEKKEEGPGKQLEKKPLLFQKKESERAALARKSSYAYKKASEDTEEWLELTVCGPKSQLFTERQHRVFARGKPKAISSDSGRDFVQKLNFLSKSTESYEDELLEGTSPLVPVVKRLTAIMHRGVPVPYSVLRSQFPSVDDHDLLTALASCAVLVRGNFYLQSRLLQWDSHVVQARNFILFVLQSFGNVQRVGVEAVYEKSETVSSDWIETILQQIAMRDHHCWKPRISDDISFCKTFPEQVRIYSQFWDRQGARLGGKLQIYQSAIL
jgi:DNA-directed RNA polymerase-3 subunit RPC5